MDKEQREHTETMLIDMTEKLPKKYVLLGDNLCEYSPDMLRAAAEAAHALIALHNAARPVVGRGYGKNQKGADTMNQEKSPVGGITKLTEDDAWELVVKAVQNIRGDRTCSRAGEFEKLPSIVQKILRRPDRLYEWVLIPERMLHTEIRVYFREAFRELSAREEPRGKVAEMTIVLHVDTTELDEALAKAERLAETLRRAGSGE